MAKEFPFGRPPFEIEHVEHLSRPRYGQISTISSKFWEYMIRQRRTAHWARERFKISSVGAGHGSALSSYREQVDGPVWCFTRYGRTVTQLPFGRLLYVGGEHEDSYDRDFCIYNDVVVEDVSGDIEIYGYSKDLFPPTDFHTATLVGDDLWLIGSLGYKDLRREGETQVVRLDVDSMRIDAIETTGEKPGWISDHSAEFDRKSNEIVVSGGKVWSELAGKMELAPNTQKFALSLKTLRWHRVEESLAHA